MPLVDGLGPPAIFSLHAQAIVRSRKICVTSHVAALRRPRPVPERYGLKRPVIAVEKCRKIGKADLPHNDATPEIRVDPDTYRVWADGELLACEPAAVLPMAQRYFLF